MNRRTMKAATEMMPINPGIMNIAPRLAMSS
jgi:hypothetical protein